MTDKEINIAIAESCGWKRYDRSYTDSLGKVRCIQWEDTPGHPLPLGDDAVPNYCGDLNAMREAEMTLPVQPTVPLTRSKREIFRDELFALCDQPIHAEARQRAEAFVQTMVKWRGK